jgi:uncharacterized protein
MASPRPVALITGASAGIGTVFARRLAERGYDLILVARRQERLEQVARELAEHYGAHSEILSEDLTDPADLAKVEEHIDQTANLEILVNNAGFGTIGRFYESPLAAQDQMHRLHVLATVRLCHAALRLMTARGKGTVINVSSLAAYSSRPGTASYHATKAWMNASTEGLYMDLKSSRSPVLVQALCPGFTLTEFHDVLGVDRKRIPASLWMSAEDVVDASLRALDRRKLFVIPGWRYKALFVLLSLLPRPVLRAASMLDKRL